MNKYDNLSLITHEYIQPFSILISNNIMIINQFLYIT